ncbi:DUF2721 domain-containing protein [Paraglaciecola hydrolytica]|uniref:DUF2721 domain-containing protein n=1 Tax=Paraglaciecola hydrolytica TaxID=1799789 RepID=A0A136A200_9ALTE|nr:DUF2721 domain-containing protein [Paraglaciecola hydrolytica]KXI29269.1 hypothetical protein AX660_14080 [Paraglaciecola hydrolytica]
MDITLTTPAMLFPAISLLLLAYTNRFLTLASVIRNFDLSADNNIDNAQAQITNLRARILLIKRMQEAGAGSFFLCVLSMLAIYINYLTVGSSIFAISLVLLLYSLWLSVREIRISVEALDMHLSHLNIPLGKKRK